jgi:hypothetical protein
MTSARLRLNFIMISFSLLFARVPTSPASEAQHQRQQFKTNSIFIQSNFENSGLGSNLANGLRCPGGTSPLYSTIVVHGAGDAMLCALARAEALNEFDDRKQRAKMECELGGENYTFQEASRQESTPCECSAYTPSCQISFSQEFFCCGPAMQR